MNKHWVSVFGRMAYAPTTLTQLAALVPDYLHANIQLIDEGVSFFNPHTIEADLVGISVLTPDAPRAYTISGILMDRGIKVVLGGWHPTLMPEEAAEHADAIVIGYAEKSWPSLLDDFASGRLKKIYREECRDIFESSLPTPRYDLLKKWKYMLPYTIEATRGCLNKCSFCVISGCAHYNSFMTRDPESVISQIKETKARHISFIDSSPTENTEYIKDLYRRLIPLKIKWKSAITLKVAEDDDWLELASASGCNMVLIGFESLNQESLSGINKGFNQALHFKESIRKLHNRNIMVFACFVFGWDEDTTEIFRRTVDFVNDTKIDVLNYFLLTPYPQTPLYRKLESENRIFDRNWENYNGTKVVYHPGKMSAEELQKGFEKATLQSYSAKSIVKRMTPPRNSFVFNTISNIYFSAYNHLRFS